MAQAYFSLVTNAGKIKLAQSAAGGDPIVITHFAIGDGNGAETNPTAANTALVREVWRTQVESVVTDPDNPSAVLVTAIIPTTAGGWWMREFGIFDQAGAMIAVARPVSQYKPTALEGQLEDIRYEFQLIIGENANVTLLVDPSLIFATRAWVEARRITMSQLPRLPWLPVVSMTLSSAPGSPSVGDCYLVPSNATGVWAANIGKIAEWSGSAWLYITPPDGHGVSLPDGRVFERVAGAYVEKIALDAQSGKWFFAIAGGTANVLTASLVPMPLALTIGMSIKLLISAANTGAATLNANGLGAKPIVTMDGFALSANDLSIGETISLVYDGASWRLRTPLAATEADIYAGVQNKRFVSPAIQKSAKATFFTLRQSSTALPNNTVTLVSFNTSESQLTDSTLTANRFTVGPKDAGLWQISIGGQLIVTGDLLLLLDDGGSNSFAGAYTPNIANPTNSVSTILRLAAGAILQVRVRQSAAAGTIIMPAGDLRNFFTAVRLGA